MWDPLFLTRDQTCIPAWAGGFLTTGPSGKSCKKSVLLWRVKSRMMTFLLRGSQCRAMPFLCLAEPRSHPALWSIQFPSVNLLVFSHSWWANFPQRQKRKTFSWLKYRTSAIFSLYEKWTSSRKKKKNPKHKWKRCPTLNMKWRKRSPETQGWKPRDASNTEAFCCSPKHS